MTRTLRVAAVHANAVFMDVEGSVEKAIATIESAGAQDVDLLVFPEAAIPGYPYWTSLYPMASQVAVNLAFLKASLEVPGPEISRLQGAAARASVAVVLGISERLRGTGTCFNSQVFIDRDGTVLDVHRKLQPTAAERFVWAQGGGATLSVHPLAGARVGALACWENTMNLARHALADAGEEVHAASWPGLSAFSGNEHNRLADTQISAMMLTHALTSQTFVVAAGSPVDNGTLQWMDHHLGSQDDVGLGAAGRRSCTPRRVSWRVLTPAPRSVWSLRTSTSTTCWN